MKNGRATYKIRNTLISFQKEMWTLYWFSGPVVVLDVACCQVVEPTKVIGQEQGAAIKFERLLANHVIVFTPYWENCFRSMLTRGQLAAVTHPSTIDNDFDNDCAGSSRLPVAFASFFFSYLLTPSNRGRTRHCSAQLGHFLVSF